MLPLFEYIKMMMCNHDLEYSERDASVTDDHGQKRTGPIYCMICKKCGHHKSGWKFNLKM